MPSAEWQPFFPGGDDLRWYTDDNDFILKLWVRNCAYFQNSRTAGNTVSRQSLLTVWGQVTHMGINQQEGYHWFRHRPTNDISIKFEIQQKFATVLWFKVHSTNHNEILHTSRQLHCRDVCKISLWSVQHILNQSTPNFYRISNLMELLGAWWWLTTSLAPNHYMTQCWLIDDGEQISVKFESKYSSFHIKKWFENVVCKMVILSWPQCGEWASGTSIV